MSKLPVSRVVNVGVQMTPAGAQAQSLSDLLVLGTANVIDPKERMRAYSDAASIGTEFGTSSDEYKCAQLWFQQTPQPTQLLLGRWIKTAIGGGLRAAPLTAGQQNIANFTGITSGAFRFSKDGGALTSVSSLNFSGAANLNAVAAIIEAAMSGVTVTWNAAQDRFELTSQTTGISSAISFLEAPVAGTDVSQLLGGRSNDSGAYVFAGSAAESVEEALNVFDDRFGQQWYATVIPAASKAEQVAAAGVIQASINKHVLGCTTQEAGSLSAVTSDDLASQMQDLGYNRVFVQYSATNPNAAVSALARILTTNYTAENTVITLKFKLQPGVIAEEISTSQANVLRDKNCNVFAAYNNDTAILQEGAMSGGAFADEIMGTDWLAVTIQRDVYNILYTSLTKIPQTDQGQQILLTAVEAVCSQGVINGLIAPGVWNAGGFGTLKQGDFLNKGFYVYSASYRTQAQADRTERKAMPIQVAAKLAGAIHSVDVLVNVNQ